MANDIRDHIHIHGLDETAEAGEYHVLQGTWDATPLVPMASERGFTGKLHVHRLLDDVGDVIHFTADTMGILATKVEMHTLVDLIGCDIYFIGLDHPETGDTTAHAAERISAVLAIKAGTVVNVDPACQYWKLGIEILDNERV